MLNISQIPPQVLIPYPHNSIIREELRNYHHPQLDKSQNLRAFNVDTGKHLALLA